VLSRMHLASRSTWMCLSMAAFSAGLSRRCFLCTGSSVVRSMQHSALMHCPRSVSLSENTPASAAACSTARALGSTPHALAWPSDTL